MYLTADTVATEPISRTNGRVVSRCLSLLIFASIAKHKSQSRELTKSRPSTTRHSTVVGLGKFMLSNKDPRVTCKPQIQNVLNQPLAAELLKSGENVPFLMVGAQQENA